jgi:CheY-like chemotaxis protein
MPGMSGVELIQQILTIRPDIPVILCTGFNRDNVSLDIEKLGIKALLRKPFPRLVLARKIREVLDS